ncbi:MAG: response regulator transcription factor [Solirubrobacteraceae bacterium]|nr:response regulator transcription factor [Solirubrobacteraceae bacterium]
MSESRASVLLAEDHAVIREGLRLLLERDGAFEVVAEAGNGDDVLRYVRGHRPDVVVLDLNMPGRDSLDLLPEIPECSPSTRVVVLTMQTDPAFARAALRAGASGYVLKEAAHEELLRAIEAVREGRTYVDPSVGAQLASVPDEPPGQPDGLTDREVEVLERIALGETNAEAAAALFISIRTVETHRAHIQQKTGCTSRSQLVRYTREHGLLS